jgi:hypothetical protein
MQNQSGIKADRAGQRYVPAEMKKGSALLGLSLPVLWFISCRFPANTTNAHAR